MLNYQETLKYVKLSRNELSIAKSIKDKYFMVVYLGGLEAYAINLKVNLKLLFDKVNWNLVYKILFLFFYIYTGKENLTHRPKYWGKKN